MEDTETTGEFNLQEAAEEIIAEGESTTASSENDQGAGQSEQEPNTNTEDQELSPEDILNQVANEQGNSEQFADLLKAVNGFGMTKNGIPVSVETPDQLKELIQKGFDYTYKTQEHAKVAEAKEAEFAQKENAFKEREQAFVQQEQAFEQGRVFNQLMMDLLGEVRASDPELFEHIDGLFTQKERAHLAQKPLQKQFNSKISELENEVKSIKSQKQTEELNGIKQGWEKELSEVQTKVAGSLSKLGVTVDWNKVKETWTADASNKLTVNQALYAVYGADIQKANESYKKLLETKAKTSAKLLGRTGVGNGQRGGEETIEANNMGDYDSILKQASQTM